MVATILLKLLLFLAVFELASAIAGHRVYGTRFSLALPRITTSDGVVPKDTKYIGSLYMMTEEERSTVKVFYPVAALKQDTVYDTKEHHLVYRISKEVFIPKMYLFPEYNSTGVYNTVKITSTSPIRVILNRYNKNEDSADSHNVMPLGSCSTNYYVSTGAGWHHFLMVMTFDSKVAVKMTFLRLGQIFFLHCHADKPCKDGSVVRLTLGKNKAWYVELPKQDRFLNTLIETDKPVFVVAGNKNLVFEGEKDLVVRSIYPTEAWGKEYIVPRFTRSSGEDQELDVQFSYQDPELKVQIFDGKEITEETIWDTKSYYTISGTHGPIVIRGKVPFGLYQIFGRGKHNKEGEKCVATIVNLIPIEQWSNGVVFSVLHHNKNRKHINVLFTNALRNHIVLTKPKSNTKKNYITWEKKSLTYSGRTYHVGDVTFGHLPATLYTKDPAARLIVYQFNYHKSSCSGQALDFYQANIDRLQCKLTKIVPDDGVDNDCDGYVDEEVKDLKDNDGDGKTDEDLVSHGPSTWGVWQEACQFDCGKAKATLRVRSCNKARFGKDCDGKPTHCPPLKACPATCEGASILLKCRCLKGCQACQKNSAVCPRCKAGYYDNKYCSRPCPKGWKGNGCSNEIMPNIFKKPKVVSNPHTTASSFKRSFMSSTESSYYTSSNTSSNTNSDTTEYENETEEDDEDDTPITTYIFIVLGVLVFLLLVCCMVWMLCCQKKAAPPGEQQADQTKEVDAGSNEGGTSYASESRAETETVGPTSGATSVTSAGV